MFWDYVGFFVTIGQCNKEFWKSNPFSIYSTLLCCMADIFYFNKQSWTCYIYQ